MSSRIIPFGIVPAVMFPPLVASAATTAQVLAFFNLFVGLMLVSSVVLFGVGFVVYVTRLGTWPTYRDQGVEIMKYGVGTLFTLVVILMIQQYLALHLNVAVTIAGLIIIIAIIWVVVKAYATSGEDKEKK